MFYHKQDTSLLQYSLISSAQTNAGTLCDLKDFQSAVNIVYNSIRKILHHNLEGIIKENDVIKIQLCIHRRLHAAVFYVTLRSCGITSSLAENFYSSISYAWPKIDLNFYIELNFKSHWSEYFIECAAQLPSETLVTLFKKMLNISFPEQIKIYVWHLILQTIIHKVLEISFDSDEILPFNFEFSENGENANKCIELNSGKFLLCNKDECNNESLKLNIENPLSSDKNESKNECLKSNNDNNGILKISQDLDSLLKVYYILFDNLCTELEKSNNVLLINLLLHALKTLLKSLSNKKCNILLLPEFGKICRLVKDCFTSKFGLIKEEITDSCKTHFVSHEYATTSWEISKVYLILILNHFHSDLKYTFNDESGHVDNPSAEAFILEILDDYIYEALKRIYPFVTDTSFIPESYIKLLVDIIHLGYTGAPYATEIALSNPVLLSNSLIYKALNEHTYLINLKKVYPLIIDNSIMMAVSSLDKTNALHLFYKLLLRNPVELHNEILEYILKSYGLTDKFQLPDEYDLQLSQVVRQTLTTNTAVEILPALFIQNPESTLNCIIEQGLVQGSGAEVLIQVLRFFPAACTYSKGTKDISLLLQMLNDYLMRVKLETYESKNFIILFKLLMQVQSKAKIICLNQLIEKCILENLHPPLTNRMKLVLDCLEVSLNVLISSKSFQVSPKSLVSLITCLSEIIDKCIENGNGRMKESVVLVLSALENYQKETNIIDDESKQLLFSSSKRMHEITQIYIKNFFPENLEFTNLTSLWTVCCKNKMSAGLEDKITHGTLTYSSLLSILNQTLPHFTKEEWLYSVTLIKLCCKTTLQEEILKYFDMPFELAEKERNLYAIVSCLISSLHFILTRDIGEPLYISSCFSSTLMSTLNQDVLRPQMLLTVFLDVCHLISCLSPDLINIFTSTLLDLKHCILTCADEHCKLNYRKLINYSIKCLPESLEKSVVLNKLV